MDEWLFGLFWGKERDQKRERGAGGVGGWMNEERVKTKQ